ncbi:MAG: ribosomal protein S18-alanine N-acetyltransferase [Chloroflexi bacterium]|nr:ribosomal protein S18-alanine N-acetyltransferase [Chloroflexota bacterium]
MPYYVRLMHREDVTLITEIDHEAFPTMWPPANYERELQTWLAHYIVAYEESKTAGEPAVTVTPGKSLPSLVSRVGQFFNHNRIPSIEEPSPTDRQYIVGFAGFWMMADEAHITNIAVRQSYRRQGIGELLLISMISLAMELNAHILTLEVRASNIAAQGLYYKYGFAQVGVRQGYYTDDKEDALVLSTEDITSVAFQKHLNQLKKTHSRRWGVALYHIAR